MTITLQTTAKQARGILSYFARKHGALTANRRAATSSTVTLQMNSDGTLDVSTNCHSVTTLAEYLPAEWRSELIESAAV